MQLLLSMKQDRMLLCLSPPDPFCLYLQVSNEPVQFHPAMFSHIRLSAQAWVKRKVILNNNFNVQELIVIPLVLSHLLLYYEKEIS